MARASQTAGPAGAQEDPAREQIARVESLLERLETSADPAARALATELVQALLDLYGEGLARLVEILAPRDTDGELADALAGDELIAHLLLLHGLHPAPPQERVQRALAEVRPYLQSHGGEVELLAVQDGVATVRLQGSCSGCPSSTITLKQAIEQAIFAAAPEVQEVRAEDEAPGVGAGLLTIETVGAPLRCPLPGTGAELLELQLNPALAKPDGQELRG